MVTLWGRVRMESSQAGLTLKRLSCNTRLMAASSPEGESLVWKTTPNDPLPTILHCEYCISLVSPVRPSCTFSRITSARASQRRSQLRAREHTASYLQSACPRKLQVDFATWRVGTRESRAKTNRQNGTVGRSRVAQLVSQCCGGGGEGAEAGRRRGDPGQQSCGRACDAGHSSRNWRGGVWSSCQVAGRGDSSGGIYDRREGSQWERRVRESRVIGEGGWGGGVGNKRAGQQQMMSKVEASLDLTDDEHAVCGGPSIPMLSSPSCASHDRDLLYYHGVRACDQRTDGHLQSSSPPVPRQRSGIEQARTVMRLAFGT
nr:hypothetical protein CFP56_34921 [Quercus suber]